MGLIWLALAAVVIWTLVRLGRQTEAARRGHWRISATMVSAACFAGACLAAYKGGWLLSAGLAGAGAWLAIASRQRLASPRRDDLAMSLSEACSILGVGPDASPDEIRSAWRRAAARVHPDVGGTEGLAARVNAARDRLLDGR